MKKKSGSRIGTVLSRLINIRLWSDWERTKTLSRNMLESASRIFVPTRAVASESFEAAKKRLGLSDDALLIRQKNLLRISLFMLMLAFFFFIYAGYHFFFRQFIGCILSLVVMSIALVLAFRYHFWSFQIKQRKLGCSLMEWWRSLKGDENL
jgi:intracellular multiplication protein IcmV